MIHLSFNDGQKEALGNLIARELDYSGSMSIEWTQGSSTFVVKFHAVETPGYVGYLVNENGGIERRFTGGLD